jgi:hypothetical protein
MIGRDKVERDGVACRDGNVGRGGVRGHTEGVAALTNQDGEIGSLGQWDDCERNQTKEGAHSLQSRQEE